LEAAFNLTNLALGLSVFFSRPHFRLLILSITLTMKYLQTIKKENACQCCPVPAFLFILSDKYFFKDGFAYDPQTKIVSMERYKYFHNILEMPVVMVLFLTGVVLVLSGIVVTILKNSKRGMWFSRNRNNTGSIFIVSYCRIE